MLNTTQAAEHLGLTQGHLRNLRVKGNGPSYHKIGPGIRYDKRDLNAWANERTNKHLEHPAHLTQEEAEEYTNMIGVNFENPFDTWLEQQRVTTNPPTTKRTQEIAKEHDMETHEEKPDWAAHTARQLQKHLRVKSWRVFREYVLNHSAKNLYKNMGFAIVAGPKEDYWLNYSASQAIARKARIESDKKHGIGPWDSKSPIARKTDKLVEKAKQEYADGKLAPKRNPTAKPTEKKRPTDKELYNYFAERRRQRLA